MRIRERLKSSVNLTPGVTPTPRKPAPHSRSLKRCVLGGSLPETGFAIRGSEKKKKNGPKREAANIPPRSQNQRKGKRRRAGLLAFHRLPYFWILQETAAAARAPGQTIPGLTAAFSLQPQLPSQPSLGVGGLS